MHKDFHTETSQCMWITGNLFAPIYFWSIQPRKRLEILKIIHRLFLPKRCEDHRAEMHS